MKSLIIISLLSFTLAGGLAESQASNYYNEPTVDDIPFNTAAVAGTTDNHDLFVKLWDLEEETPAMDIPFDTEKIAFHAMADQMVENRHEVSVEDVPFDTEMIASNAMVEQNVTSDYVAENSVNDLPFNTIDEFLEVAFHDYFEEKTVCDFPYRVMTIYCSNVICEKEKETLYLTAEKSDIKNEYKVEVSDFGGIPNQEFLKSIKISLDDSWLNGKITEY